MHNKPDLVNKMALNTEEAAAHCCACVFYPPNLPAGAYAADDYKMLQEKNCSFDFEPADRDCVQTRKTSCSLLDLGRPD